MRWVLFAVGLLCAVPGTAANQRTIPDEHYEFRSVIDSACWPQAAVKMAAAQRAECSRLTAPRRYRGTWRVAFETSIFTPAGNAGCVEGVTMDYCPDLILRGKRLPWPSRWACPQEYDIEFIGRRSLHPGKMFGFDVAVDRVISAKRLPDPPHEPGECDPNAK